MAWVQSIETEGRARTWVWLMRAGSVVVLTLGTLLAAFGAGRTALPGAATLAWFIVSIAGALLIAQLFHDLSRRLSQHVRDLRAQRLFDKVRAGADPGAFILYLRPFASTDALAQSQLRPVRVGRTAMVVAEDRLEIEAEIEAELRRTAPLIALGKPLEHEGAGRIAVTDEHWQTAIDALMEAAAMIILLPSPREGTLWEIDRLIAGEHLAKTLILDPPNLGSSRPDYDPEAEWGAVQTAFAERGFAVPDDRRDGMILSFDPGAVQPTLNRAGLDVAGALGAIVRRSLTPET